MTPPNASQAPSCRRERQPPIWRQLSRDYRPRFQAAGAPDGQESDSELARKAKSRNTSAAKLAASRRIEELKLLASTDFGIVNSAEPFREPASRVFMSHLQDPALVALVVAVYLISSALTSCSNALTFVVLLSCLLYLANYHLDSYQAFRAVNRSAGLLADDNELRRIFLGVHLGIDHGRVIRVKHAKQESRDNENENETDGRPRTRASARAARASARPFQRLVSDASSESRESSYVIEEPVKELEHARDSFNWINQIIEFFWPYLSHLVHFELNRFLREQLSSGRMARSERGSIRLLDALIRQINMNTVAIEKCQLGDQAPSIKSIDVLEHSSMRGKGIPIARNEQWPQPPQPHAASPAATRHASLAAAANDKRLVFNIKVEYNGDMQLALVYKYFCCCSSRLGLKDVFLHFNLRMILEPVRKEMPFLDSVSFTLLELPRFGYKGIALVELAELRFVRNLANRLMAETILYPRRVTIQVRDLLYEIFERRPLDSSRDELERIPEAELALLSAHAGSSSMSSTSRAASGRHQKGGPPRPEEQRVSFLSRLYAQALLCSCICSNSCLRACQTTTSRRHTDERRSGSRSRRSSRTRTR